MSVVLHKIGQLQYISMESMLTCKVRTLQILSKVGLNFKRSWVELQVKLDSSKLETFSTMTDKMNCERPAI